MKKVSIFLIASILLWANSVLATPTFQAYINGASAGDFYEDQDTWFSADNSFDLFVAGAFGPKTTSLEGVTLLISVPNAETGTISIVNKNNADEIPVLRTIAGSGSGPETNPLTDADTSILSNESGNTGYLTTDFLPSGFNNHYPLQNDVSDFFIFDLFAFDGSESNLNDYNADDGGSIVQTGASGEQKEYEVFFTGFTQVHFDVYGLEVDDLGKKLKTTWDMSPGSHDSTAKPVPEPATLFLFGSGLIGLARFRKRIKR